MKVSILHVSDLHFGKYEQVQEDTKVYIPTSLERRFRAAGVFREAIADCPIKPDAVVVSGDITTRHDESGFSEFKKALPSIWNQLPRTARDRCVAVPGNHDVPWEVSAPVSDKDRYSNFVKVTQGCTRPWLQGYDEDFTEAAEALKLAQKPYFYDPNKGLLVYALDSTLLCGRLSEPREELKKRIETIRASLSSGTAEFDTLLHDLQRHDGASVGPKQLQLMNTHLNELRGEELQNEAYDKAFKIAVLHHPLDHLAGAPIELKTFEMIVDGGPVKSALRRHGFHMVLHGHKHFWQLTRIAPSLGDQGILSLSGGTVGGAPALGQPICFNWIDIEMPTNQTRWHVTVRRFDINVDDVGRPADIWENPTIEKAISVRYVPRTRKKAQASMDLKEAVEDLTSFCQQPKNEGLLSYAKDVIRALLPETPMSNERERSDLIRRLDRLIRAKGTSLYAIDVLGPQLWLQPDSLTYFAKQVWPYISATQKNGRRKIVVTHQLGTAISRCSKRFASRFPNLDGGTALMEFPEQPSIFNKLGSFEVGIIRHPSFEIARILIWPEEMLRTPTAAAIIRLHEEFGVPLFFLNRADSGIGFEDWRDPRVDYCLKCQGSKYLSGFYGYSDREGMVTLDPHDPPPPSLFGYNRRTPRFKTLLEEFLSFLENQNLLLAADARLIALAQRTRE